MAEMNSFNGGIIAEFRANEGVVGGPFAGMPILLLHHEGRRSGTERVAPLTYRREGDAYVVFGSKAGAATHPDWFRNVAENPDTSIEVGSEIVAVRARVADGDEHDRLWAAQVRDVPTFGEYDETSGDRVIPVIVLDPR